VWPYSPAAFARPCAAVCYERFVELFDDVLPAFLCFDRQGISTKYDARDIFGDWQEPSYLFECGVFVHDIAAQ
jgi:hypothetical protein